MRLVETDGSAGQASKNLLASSSVLDKDLGIPRDVRRKDAGGFERVDETSYRGEEELDLLRSAAGGPTR